MQARPNLGLDKVQELTVPSFKGGQALDQRTALVTQPVNRSCGGWRGIESAGGHGGSLVCGPCREMGKEEEDMQITPKEGSAT